MSSKPNNLADVEADSQETVLHINYQHNTIRVTGHFDLPSNKWKHEIVLKEGNKNFREGPVSLNFDSGFTRNQEQDIINLIKECLPERLFHQRPSMVVA